MDGQWNAGPAVEATTQAELSRHRLLRVNLSFNKEPGDASNNAQEDPNGIGPGNDNDGGPHFILSSVTPDNSHCYGFEFVLFTQGITPAATAPFTVTVWELIGNTQLADPAVATVPIWAALLPVTPVGINELWHTFDVNACAIRFQIVDEDEDQNASRSVVIGLAEL